jgi:hypothetical protein
MSDRPADYASWSREKQDAYYHDKILKNMPDFFPEGPFRLSHVPRARGWDSGTARKSEFIPAYRQGLKVLTADELLTTEFPPRNLLMDPWLPEKGLTMIHALRGVGKTWVALGTANAVASGGEFLRWKAPSPKRVLYIDGEMPMSLLKDRFARVVGEAKTEVPGPNFRLVAADYQPDGLPDLADPDAQQFYADVVADADLIVLDNYSTLAHGLKENEADSFAPIQGWLLAQRAAGRSVLAVHHSGKGGAQRGTSRKEDTLDTVISLTHPSGYSAAEGARFEVRFTKNRGFWGTDAEPFEARFAEGKWTTSEIAADESDIEIKTLRAEGRTVREIEKLTGMSRSTVSRRLNGE